MGRGMEMDGCAKFMQLLMFISNFIIWIGSIALLVLGIWAVVDRPYLENVLGESVYISAAYILIAVGVLIFLISFLGCFGALKEIKCMLLMYFVIVLLLCIILLVGGILGFVFRQQAETKLRIGMLQSIEAYGKEVDSPITSSWDDAQRAMKCCGINSRDDWSKYNNNYKNTEKVPNSCCLMDNENKVIDCTSNPDDTNSFKDGCLTKAKSFVTEHAKYIGGAGIGVAILMVLGLVFSMILFKLIN